MSNLLKSNRPIEQGLKGQPVVSVIMPAYNSGKTIGESITSVMTQVYQHWELIIVDDGSNDNTFEVVSNFQQTEARIQLLALEKNGGLPAARNAGARQAKGTYLAFLDSDDLWLNDKLQAQVEFHMAHQHIHISHTDFHNFKDNQVHKRPLKYLVDFRRDKEGLLYPKLCYKNTIGVLTVMVRKDVFFEVGGFDASLVTLEDQDLWVRISRTGKRFGYIPKILAHYRLTPGGISRRLGSYKRAYKKFIHKVLSADHTLRSNLIWRTYYRTFGIAYLQRDNYKLSQRYFVKSIRLQPFDYTAFTTYVYMAYGLLRRWMR
jgi:teichuronic acid biosynthesis glycosyltransferase TuaG